MTDKEATLETLRERLDRETPIDTPKRPIRLGLGEEGILTVEGEVRDVAEKNKVLNVAADTAGIREVVDRLHVAAPTPMNDIEIRGHLRDAFLQEPVFAEAAISIETDGGREIVRTVKEGVRSIIEITVTDGVVTLNGMVPSLSHKRLAGVLAWWVPGTRDVQNRLEVVPAEEDNDGEIADAVRLVLEKDRFVEASQVKVSCRNGVVSLEGAVPTDAVQSMAERDAWFVLGVRGVENRLQVLPAVGEKS